MEDLAAMIGSVVTVMQFSMDIWGFTVSFWQIGLWGMVASLIMYLIWGFFHG